MYINFQKKREIGEIISDSFAFMLQNWLPLLKIFAYVLLFPYILFFLLMFFFSPNIKSVVDSDPIYVIIFLACALLLVLTTIFYAITSHSYIRAYVERGDNLDVPINIMQVLGESASFLVYYLVNVFISSIITFIGAILCLFPGIIIGVAYYLLLPVMVHEREFNSVNIFNRCWDLLRKTKEGSVSIEKWFSTLAVTMLVAIIINGIFYLFYYAIMLLIFLLGIVLSDTMPFVVVLMAFLYILAILLYLFLSNISAVAINLHYFALREALEAKGLINKIDSFENLGGSASSAKNDKEDEERY